MPWRLIEAISHDDSRAATLEVDGDLTEDELFYFEGDLLLALNAESDRPVTLDLRRFTPSDFGLFAGLYSIRKRIRNENPLRILVTADSVPAQALKQGRFTGIFEIAEEAPVVK
jgi:hypothetical protein